MLKYTKPLDKLQRKNYVPVKIKDNFDSSFSFVLCTELIADEHRISVTSKYYIRRLSVVGTY